MLRSSNNKFDQSVKRTLENASVEAPAFLWNKIESKLPPVTSWYSKYKYLLLLLLLSFTSATSIFVYKTFFVTKEASRISLNHQYFRDERTPENKGVAKITPPENNSTQNQTSKTVVSNPAANLNNSASVASFYPKESENKSASNTREEKLKRYEVKSKNENENETLNPSVQTSNSEASNSPLLSDASAEKISNQKIKGKDKNTAALNLAVTESLKNTDNISDTKNIAANTNDITQPITEPIRGVQSEPLTASVTPTKIQASPIGSRDLLRSTISPEKLEKLDVESQTEGVNKPNPAIERMQRNIKQFKGYDINRGFHIGPLFAINNNWLSKKQYSADENTLSLKPKMHFGKSYGVNIGFDYTNRWGVELEWQISEQGQNYSVRETDGWHNKTVNLKYTKFPVMVKYRQVFMNNYATKPIAINVLLGPQMAFLLKSKVEQDGKPVKNPADYNKIELGLAAGFDFDLYLTRFMYLTVGARTGFGSTLRKGQPMSYQLGISTQLNFRFPKKL